MTETKIERLEREHKANLDALESLLRQLPDSAVRSLANMPAVKGKLREFEQENLQ